MFLVEECHECAHHEPALKERPMEEVAARLAQQDQAEQDTLAGRQTHAVPDKIVNIIKTLRMVSLVGCFDCFLPVITFLFQIKIIAKI